MPPCFGVTVNKSDGSKYVSFSILRIQSRNPIVFSPDDTTSCSAASGDPGPLDVARSIIDRDIARLEESIRVLKSRRNELAPISRLPAEILCKIFSFIEDTSIIYVGRSPELWINFSQVSQHWRIEIISSQCAGTLDQHTS